MTEKKNGDYEKPESLGEGENLEDVSGGFKPPEENRCGDGSRFWLDCNSGNMATQGCRTGPSARGKCKTGQSTT